MQGHACLTLTAQPKQFGFEKWKTVIKNEEKSKTITLLMKRFKSLRVLCICVFDLGEAPNSL